MKILTKRKQAWVEKRRPDILRGKPIIAPSVTEIKYYAKLRRMIKAMCDDVDKQIEKLFTSDAASEFYAMDASISSQARIITNALIKKHQEAFNQASKPMAEGFVGQINKDSSREVHASLKQLSGGLSLPTSELEGQLGDILSASITENVSLIRSIPQQYLSGVQGAVMRSITEGGGRKDLVQYLKKHEGITLRRAHMIASDQNNKVMQSLSRSRMQNVGVKKFEWRHTGGSNEPRRLHVQMNGNIYSWDEPPVIEERTGVRGFPGQAVNCFIGSTKVSLANGCANLWRYYHFGDICVIEAEDGSVIECTINHPILTSRGWLKANDIQEGDYLICSPSNNAGVINNKSTRDDTTFDELFASFDADSVVTTSLSKFNFHGDMPHEDVDTIIPQNMLPYYRNIPSAEQIEKLILATPNSVVSDFIPRIISKIMKPGLSGCLRKICSFFGRKSTQPHLISPASISEKDAIFFKNLPNSLSRYIVFFRQRKSAVPGLIGRYYGAGLLINHFNFNHRWDLVAASFFQRCRKPAPTAASCNNTDFPEAHSFIEKFLRVEKKSVRIYRGHVYTMESYSGWYSVSSANVISKNCRCRAVPVIDFLGD